MKKEFIQIFHTKTEKGWQPSDFRPKAVIPQEHADYLNQHFNEFGRLCVPKQEYEKFKKNELLLN